MRKKYLVPICEIVTMTIGDIMLLSTEVGVEWDGWKAWEEGECVRKISV